jgi:NADPH:quinone reductase-like Zn-dependent oxidoreductase
MKAVLLKGFGGVDQLSYEEVDRPHPADGEVLVRIRATSVNPVDYKIRSGRAGRVLQHMAKAGGDADTQLPAILGRDLSGEIVELGTGVEGFHKGDRVMALANSTYAEYCVARADVLAQIPDELDFEHAAALPLVSLTGAQLIERAIVPSAGQKILVAGAVGSVGRTAVYVARHFGAHVIAGVRKSQKKEAHQVLLTEEVYALNDPDEMKRLRDLDAIADTVGGKTASNLLAHLRAGGIFGTVLGKPGGADRYDVRVQAIMTMPDALRLRRLAEDVAHEAFSIPIDRVMPLSEIREAHRLAEAGGLDGKIVLVP